jgi:hypothetical protein
MVSLRPVQFIMPKDDLFLSQCIFFSDNKYLCGHYEQAHVTRWNQLLWIRSTTVFTEDWENYPITDTDYTVSLKRLDHRKKALSFLFRVNLFLDIALSRC